MACEAIKVCIPKSQDEWAGETEQSVDVLATKPISLVDARNPHSE